MDVLGFHRAATAQPDLVVASITPNATSVTQGASFGFSYVVQNIGAAAAGMSWAGIYLDQQTTTLPMGWNQIAGLGATAPAPETNSFSTAGLGVGQHTLWVKADYWNDATGMANSAYNDVVESNEYNNWTSVTFNVTAPGLPDLMVASIAGNASVTQGATYSFSYTIQNVGAAAAGMSWAGIYLDQQTTTLPMGWNRVGALNPNVTATETNSFSTAGLVGQHTLWIKADYWNDATNMANSGNNDVVESNETNNWLSLSFNVTAPDLVVASITGNASVTQGATYSFSYTIQNIGAAAAGQSWAGVYLDQQTTTLPMGWNRVGALNPNGTAIETNSFSTAGLAGQHTLWIKADYWNDATNMANSGNNDVVESNETNNWLSLSFNVTAPDLVVASITGNTSVTRGATYSFSYTIQNIGTAAAGMSWAGIYLDQQTTTLPMGWNRIGALNPNVTAPETNSFSTAGLSVGAHTLWIKADYWNDATNMANSGNNDVVESNETNNWLSLSFNVTASMTSMTSSSSMVVATAAPSSSSTSLAVAPGATVEISSAFDKQAAFVGDTGTLKLDDPSSFSGTVAGMTGQDTIDFASINFSAVQTPTYSGDNSGGTLTVTDGAHNANIALLGNYLASTFVASSDGHGGTSVVDVPAASVGQHAPLSPPQHA
jgi:subtilase family serine protease